MEREQKSICEWTGDIGIRRNNKVGAEGGIVSEGVAQVIGDVSKVEKKIWVLLDSTGTSFSATPTAASGVDWDMPF